jgi:hypothetical protein
MRSILVAPAAWILRVSRILHGNGTLTHYRGLPDDGMRGHRGRGSTDDPSAPRSLGRGLRGTSPRRLRLLCGGAYPRPVVRGLCDPRW